MPLSRWETLLVGNSVLISIISGWLCGATKGESHQRECDSSTRLRRGHAGDQEVQEEVQLGDPLRRALGRELAHWDRERPHAFGQVGDLLYGKMWKLLEKQLVCSEA